MQVSLDGYVAAPDGNLDWMVWNWDDELKNYVGQITEPIDLILLGRKLAEGFIPHWAAAAADPQNPQVEAGKKFSGTPKIVFSRTLDTCEWENTILMKDASAAAIKQIKSQPGSDIIAYGGASFVSGLIQQNLVDEYHLFINPTALGKGLAIFNALEGRLNLKLVKATPFECGIVVLVYQPA
jgi:dihydrofolate reductase